MDVSTLTLDLDLVGSPTTFAKYTLVLNQTVIAGDDTPEKVTFLKDVLAKVIAAYPGKSIEVPVPAGHGVPVNSLASLRAVGQPAAPAAGPEGPRERPHFATELLAAARELRAAANTMQAALPNPDTQPKRGSRSRSSGKGRGRPKK